jgi:hypothetical protein
MAEPGTITDEGVARLRARIGVPEPHPQPPHYLRPDADAFRHVAIAYGDDNALWCDPGYAAGTRWGGLIAPPPLAGGDTLVGEDEVGALAPESAGFSETGGYEASGMRPSRSRTPRSRLVQQPSR